MPGPRWKVGAGTNGNTETLRQRHFSVLQGSFQGSCAPTHRPQDSPLPLKQVTAMASAYNPTLSKGWPVPSLSSSFLGQGHSRHGAQLLRSRRLRASPPRAEDTELQTWRVRDDHDFAALPILDMKQPDSLRCLCDVSTQTESPRRPSARIRSPAA